MSAEPLQKIDCASELEQFRLTTRSWLENHCPPSLRDPNCQQQLVWAGRQQTFPSADARIWFQRMRDKGWTVPDWPTQYGGAGLDEQQCKLLDEEMKRINCPTPLSDLGIWMLGPALLEFGSEQQKREHLPPIARGEIRWCQGYSEPGAGSDLASLQCRAEDNGDHFAVSGSKIWTTNADKADWIFCLVRTDSAAIKQQGISFLLIDMNNDAISVSPIPLISGSSEFCQVFFDQVKVPTENLVGQLHQGWTVAKALLKHERKLMSKLGNSSNGSNISAAQAARLYADKRHGKLADAMLRDRLVQHDMTLRALGLTHLRSFEERLNGAANPNVLLIMKYLGTEEEKRKAELLMALLGDKGLGWEGDSFSADELLATRSMLYSKALSIAGGTSEIQLNIIARRALDLPE
jgi:acyl-CoA dehydrogenase